MCEKACKQCKVVKPLDQYERNGNSLRNTCRLCRSYAKNGTTRPEVRPLEMTVEIINSFALWFGPVDRARPLMPTP